VEAFARQIAALVDVPVGVALTDPQVPQPPLVGTEGAHLDRAIDKRRREFAAGRAAARMALRQRGGPDVAIPAAADRAPVWPTGWQGSISHKDTLCAAIVTNAPVMLGLDLAALCDCRIHPSS